MALRKIVTYVIRAIPGAFILNAGLGKRDVPEEVAEGLHASAVTGVPQLAEMEPKQFAKLLSTGEIALGAALLLPFVPTKLAGLGLAAFSGGLMSMYFRNDEMTKEDGIRPSQQGTAIAKDSWLFAIALALMFSKKD